MARFPRMCNIIQRFDSPKVDDLPATVREQFQRLGLERLVKAGQSVAITAGSRGIANIAVILREVASCFLAIGARPFIVPAMGSHGGGTVEGQRKMLASLGVTEESVGIPIRGTMETVVVAQSPAAPASAAASLGTAEAAGSTVLQ